MPKKKCLICGETKNSSNFYIQLNSLDGLRNYCSECDRNQMHERCYKISPLQYNQLCTKQDNKCPICKKDFLAFETKGKGVTVNHDNDTGHAHGILCANCNTDLGTFEESLESLDGAKSYLPQYQQSGTCVTSKTL
jgi:hypothetical protein